MKTLIILFLVLGQSAFADYSFQGRGYFISYSIKDNVQVIRLEGQVLSSLVEDLSGFRKVQKLLRRGMDQKLILHSDGGFQVLFNEFARSMREACGYSCDITTYVSSSSRCFSACIPLFMVGHRRHAGVDAEFGFHQAAVVPGSFKISGKAESDLEEMGVDKTWLQDNKALFESLRITVKRPDELDGSNIVTKILR